MNVEKVNSAPARWYTLVGLVLVPILVAGGFLLAGVNSDTRLNTVQAAIVNLDEPVTIDGQYTPLGRQLTANLVDSDRTENLNWVLQTEENARAGLSTGEYAAMVVIPENFSAAATSFSENDGAVAEQATIQVYTSPVAGVADATLGRLVASEAASMLNSTLTEAYLTQIYIGFNDMGKQFVTMADGADQLADGAQKLANGISDAADGSQQLYTGQLQLATGLNTMANQTSSLPSDVRKLSNGVGDYVDGANQLAQQTIESLPQQVQLADGLAQLSQGATGIASGLSTYQQGLQTGAAQAGQGATAVTQALAGYSQGAVSEAALRGTVGQVCPTVDTGNTPAELVTGAQVCIASMTATQQALNGAADGLDQSDPNTGQSLLSGSAAVAGGLSQLSSQVSSSLPDVKSTTKQLKKLIKGGNKLAAGTDELADGMPALVNGIAKSADGASQLAAGTDELSAGLYTASSGSQDLADGMREMADGIADGKDQLPHYTKSDRENLSTAVAAPVDTSTLSGLADPNVGWISLVLVLALWLGALATYSVVKAIPAGLLNSADPTAVLIGRSLLPGLVVVGVQALVVAGLAQFGLDLSPQKWLAVTGVLLLAGATFVVINHALVAWLGGLGRLISVLFAVLTTASALVGAAPALFAALRPFSPLTPALDAIRAVVTESSGAAVSLFVLVGWLLLALVASAVAVARRRTTSLAAVLAAG